MAQKIANITAPTAFSAVPANSLYGLLKALGAAFIPADSILPDRCNGLKISTPAANTGTVTLLDRSNLGGPISTASTFTVLYDRAEMKNTIDLNAFFPVGSAASQLVTVIIDYV